MVDRWVRAREAEAPVIRRQLHGTMTRVDPLEGSKGRKQPNTCSRTFFEPDPDHRALPYGTLNGRSPSQGNKPVGAVAVEGCSRNR